MAEQSSHSNKDHTKSKTYPDWHNFVAGGFAGAGSRVATAPLDLIRIRRQLSPVVTYPSESLWQTWNKIVKNEGGVTALFRGNVAAIYVSSAKKTTIKWKSGQTSLISNSCLHFSSAALGRLLGSAILTLQQNKRAVDRRSRFICDCCCFLCWRMGGHLGDTFFISIWCLYVILALRNGTNPCQTSGCSFGCYDLKSPW